VTPVGIRIVSGGQSGVDRAALDVARALGLAAGGWCPRGRRAEDGAIAPRYRLRETPSAGYAQRTAWNVRDSDGTLVLIRGALEGGTLLTVRLARERYRKPVLVVPLERGVEPARFRAWLARHRIRTLNVAGPRESRRPGIYREARAALLRLLGSLRAVPQARAALPAKAQNSQSGSGGGGAGASRVARMRASVSSTQPSSPSYGISRMRNSSRPSKRSRSRRPLQ
jgi:hypothetical protein